MTQLVKDQFDFLADIIDPKAHDPWDLYAKPQFQQHLGTEALKSAFPEVIFPTADELKLLPPPDASTRVEMPAPLTDMLAPAWQNAPAPDISTLDKSIPAPASNEFATTRVHGRHRAEGPDDYPAPQSSNPPAYINLPPPDTSEGIQ
jgi:hypothetical protein